MSSDPQTASALVLSEPLSLWGGLDPTTGTIIDVHHPQHGQVVSGAALVMPSGRGSSSASSVFVEAVRLGTAPAAIVLSYADEVLSIGALVAEELYGVATPIIIVSPERYAEFRTGQQLRVTANRIESTRAP